jgi:hypothetical protein
VDVLWQKSHLNLLRKVLCIHFLFAISENASILYRELTSGGKSNSTLYNDKYDAINVIILSVLVPMWLLFTIFLTILLRSVKCIPKYTNETMIFSDIKYMYQFIYVCACIDTK